jgi:hypothetical protein
VKAPFAAGALLKAMPEVMEISLKSTPSSMARRSGVRCTTGCACRLAPIFLSARASSNAPVTTRRISRTLSHLAASASSRQLAGVAGWVRRCTLASPSAQGRARHASSAVKTSTGASQEIRRDRTSCSTVRTARRRVLPGASQYSESLRMSK